MDGRRKKGSADGSEFIRGAGKMNAFVYVLNEHPAFAYTLEKILGNSVGYYDEYTWKKTIFEGVRSGSGQLVIPETDSQLVK